MKENLELLENDYFLQLVNNIKKVGCTYDDNINRLLSLENDYKNALQNTENNQKTKWIAIINLLDIVINLMKEKKYITKENLNNIGLEYNKIKEFINFKNIKKNKLGNLKSLMNFRIELILLYTENYTTNIIENPFKVSTPNVDKYFEAIIKDFKRIIKELKLDKKYFNQIIEIEEKYNSVAGDEHTIIIKKCLIFQEFNSLLSVIKRDYSLIYEEITPLHFNFLAIFKVFHIDEKSNDYLYILNQVDFCLKKNMDKNKITHNIFEFIIKKEIEKIAQEDYTQNKNQ